MGLIEAFLLMLLSTPAVTGSGAPQPAFVGRVVSAQTRSGIAGATISIAGLPGTVKTDSEGRFTWQPRPAAPFQIVIILPGGQVAQPIAVERLDNTELQLAVNPLADESVTVVGAAPSVSVAPASGATLLSSLQLLRRAPENLLQALETVPGVHQVSEGHSAVPAIRGMARGRTLLLIDGGRVSSERRVGPSATFADPSAFEGIDVARGPGSVAYGSDALGGVISVRTRRAEPGSPLRVRASATLGGGVPERRGNFEISKGLAAGGVLAQVHIREADDWNSPEDDSTIFNSGWADRGLLVRFDHQLGPGAFSAGMQSDFARQVERPRDNSRAVRFYNPFEDSHRLTTSYELTDIARLQRITLNGFLGTLTQRTDQDRAGTATAGRTIERADISARDYQIKGSALKALGIARIEFGVDVNGRFGLEGRDTLIGYDIDGQLRSHTTNLSVDSAARTNSGAYFQSDAAVHPSLRLAAGARGDRVTTHNSGGYFGDRATANGAFSGFGSATAGPFAGLSVTGQVSRGFRDPTLSDRYFRGPSGRGFITGNPDLGPETSLQFDLATRYARGPAQFAFYAYTYRISNLLERFVTDPDVFFFRNRGRARIDGVEVELRTGLGRGFAVEVGGSISRGTARGENADLDDVAADTLSVLVRKDFGQRLFGQMRASVLGDDDRPGPSEVAAPGATILDLAAGFKVTSHFEVRGNVRNLLDDAYFASPDPRWVYAPGRSASVTLALRY